MQTYNIIEFEEVLSTLQLKHIIEFDVTYDHGLYIFSNTELSLRIFGSTKHICEEQLLHCLTELRDEILLSDDSKLTIDAIQLKCRLIKLFT